jgi:two-component system, response regulator YesN
MRYSRIKRIIQESPAAFSSATSVAAFAGLSRRQLDYRFRQWEGMSCAEYLRKKRIERMKMLLVTTSLKNGDIAQAAGYRSESAASRAFVKEVRMTMNVFRTSITDDGGVFSANVA